MTMPSFSHGKRLFGSGASAFLPAAHAAIVFGNSSTQNSTSKATQSLYSAFLECGFSEDGSGVLKDGR